MGLCALSLGAWAYVLSESQCMGQSALSLGAWAKVFRVSVHALSESLCVRSLSLGAWANVR